MTTLLEVVAPIFGIMILGFAAGRLKVMDEAGVRGLVLFVFTFAIPALLFRSGARLDIPADTDWGFLAAFLGGSLLLYGGTLLTAGRRNGRSLGERAIVGMAAAYPNSVFLGLPVVLAAFGPEAELPLFTIVGIQSAVLMPLTVVLVQAGRGGEEGPGTRVGRLAREVARNPVVVGLAAGLAMNVAGASLPAPVDRLAELLGGAAVPCALFGLGASLAGYPVRGELGPPLGFTAVKLVAHPLLVWVLAVPLLGLEGMGVTVAVVLAGMPTAVSVYIFGARYEAAAETAARTVFLTSALSLVTVTVLLVVLGA